MSAAIASMSLVARPVTSRQSGFVGTSVRPTARVAVKAKSARVVRVCAGEVSAGGVTFNSLIGRGMPRSTFMWSIFDRWTETGRGKGRRAKDGRKSVNKR
eukprot:1175588-Prorocentrum_minimum.AAC.2